MIFSEETADPNKGEHATLEIQFVYIAFIQ